MRGEGRGEGERSLPHAGEGGVGGELHKGQGKLVMSNQKGDGLNYRSWVEVDLDNFTHNWSEMRGSWGPT